MTIRILETENAKIAVVESEEEAIARLGRC
jgi:hypothetical protein